MNPSAFTDRSPGRLVPTINGRRAFVPNPLPPVLEWSDGVVTALSRADLALGQVATLGETLPNPHLLIRPFMRREAVLSSRIEGTQASLSDVVLFEAEPRARLQTPDVREVVNYIRALEYGLTRIRSVPLSRRLICEMHEILMRGVRGGGRTPGQLRSNQVWIGAPGAPIEEATFIPAPPGVTLEQALGELERYLHTSSRLPVVVRLALVHYQFEAIHPFQDGNGRIGRLLITLMLVLEGVLPHPLLYLSAFFERHRQAYYDHLLRVSQAGAWEPWIEFFARGVATQAVDAVRRARKLRELRETYVHRVQTARSSALLVRLIESLFDQPATTIRGAAKLLDVTARSAQMHIDRLVEAGILKEITGQKRNRIYLAQEVLRVVDEPEPEEGSTP